MADYWSTTIQLAAIHVTGQVACRIDLTAAGTPHTDAHVLVGSHLVHIGDHLAAQRLAAIWREAALHRQRLPQRAGTPRPRRDAQCPAGLVIRIARDAAVRQEFLPAQPPHTPARLRIQVGPLVWLIGDQAAYTSLREVWDKLENLL